MKFFYKGKDVDFISEEKVLNILNIKEQRPNILIAKYKFDKSIYDNLMPEFNAEFTNYEIVDEYLDTEDIITTNTETITIMSYDAEPDEYGVLTTEYEVENVSTFSAENIVTRSIYSIDGSLPIKISFGQANIEAQPKELSLLGVDYLNITSATTIMASLFARCHNLQYINGVNDWDVSNVTSFSIVFYECQSLTSLDVSNWDVSNATNMYCMFYDCRKLTQLDVSNFDTSKVTNMRYMFHNCNKLTSLDVSNFDTSKVTDMQYMFNYCNSLISLDVSNFNTRNVTDMSYMFQECSNLVSIDMNNSDYNSVNKIITELPTRTTDSIGTLDITGIDDINQVNIGAAQAKFWNILNEDNSYFVLGKSKLGQDKLK